VIFRFARFAVNCDTRQLLAAGSEVHLSPKAFELLVLLIEHRSRAVSKAELQERLWPSTFVGETNLATLVAEIRRALDDSARDAAYVRTVHRFGYRFVAALVEETPAPSVPPRGARMHLDAADRHFPLAEGTAVIGRAQDAAIRIDAAGVSRHHARIIVTAEGASLEDLGSKNGTFVDGKPVTGRCALRDGGEIRVGPVALTFRIAPPTQATETML
jgi:DNA-binding winged helix-turn-helix (wHTH) protein